MAHPAPSLEEDTASGESGPPLLPSESVAATPLSGLVTKYYYFGSERVAMNKGGTLSFFAADHLGSTNVVANGSGGLVSRQTYYPFGAPRPTEGEPLPTEYTFTGQKVDASVGLMYYGARYYDAALGRFLQPDSIVPDPGNPQSLNHYSYTLNNPIRYTDPTGHCEGDQDDPDNACWRELKRIEHDFPNVHFGDPNNKLWTTGNLQQVLKALEGHVFDQDIATAKGITFYRQTSYKSQGDGIAGITVPQETNGNYNGYYNITIFDFAYNFLPNTNGSSNYSMLNFLGTVIHELTHVATTQNPSIIESYHDTEQRMGPSFPYGQMYGWSSCGSDCEREKIAIVVAMWSTTPKDFEHHFLWISYTDWRATWVERWVSSTSPHPIPAPDAAWAAGH